MTGERDLVSDVDIDLAGLLGEVWRRKLLIGVVTALSAVLLFIGLSTVDPRYKSDARIIIEKRESVFTRRSDGDFNLSTSQFDEQAIGSQVQILTSDDLALKVISQLDLATAGEFSGAAKPSIISDLLSLVGGGDGTSPVTPDERVLREFRKHLTVYAPEKSRVIVIEFWARDRKLAQQVPNALADAFLEFNKGAKLDATEEATDWLGPEIEELRGKVRDAEAKVAEFRASSDILVGNNNALLATQQLSETSSELSRLRSQRTAAQAKADSVRNALEGGGSIDAIPEVISSPLIQRLRERQVSIQAEVSEFETTLLPNHPSLKALKSQLGDFNRQLRAEAGNILTSLEDNVDLLNKQEAVLLNEVNRLKAEAARVGEAEVELRALEREATAQRELLQSYLSQFREAASRQSRNYLPVDARIISRAVTPSESYFPKVIPFTLAGTVAMFVLMVVGVLSLALLSGRAFKQASRVEPVMVPERLDSREGYAERLVETHAGGPLPEKAMPDEFPPLPANHAVDAAPAIYADPEAMRPGVGQAAFDDRYDLRTTGQAIVNMGRATIAVVSPGGDRGSATARRLARLLSEDASVILLDMTGDGVSGSYMLGDNNLPGLRNLLAGEVKFDDAVFTDCASTAHVMPAGSEQEMSGSQAIQRLVPLCEAIADTYDFVVFDCGPCGPEALSCIGNAETLVLVSQAGATPAEADEAAMIFASAGYAETIIVRDEQESAGKSMVSAA